MAYKTYNCIALTGGAERALDALSVAVLVTGDRAICSVSGVLSYFVYSSTGTAAESATNQPRIIRPDDYATGGNWVESFTAPIGAANLKLFMNAAATAPEWTSGIKIGVLTRDHTAAAGNLSYTGIGFKPSNIIFLCGHPASAMPISVGFDNGTDHYSIDYYNSGTINTALSVSIWSGAATATQAFVLSMDADGFSLTWTKVGAPTGTGSVIYMAIR